MTGDLKTAVRQALSLLSRGQAQLAGEQAEEILRRYPAEPNSLFVVAAALRAQGSGPEALDRLEALVRQAPDFALAQQELGFALADAGDSPGAIEALQKAVATQSGLPGSWKLLAELFSAAGNVESATEASNQLLLATSTEPELIRAVNLFSMFLPKCSSGPTNMSKTDSNMGG